MVQVLLEFNLCSKNSKYKVSMFRNKKILYDCNVCTDCIRELSIHYPICLLSLSFVSYGLLSYNFLHYIKISNKDILLD